MSEEKLKVEYFEQQDLSNIMRLFVNSLSMEEKIPLNDQSSSSILEKSDELKVKLMILIQKVHLKMQMSKTSKEKPSNFSNATMEVEDHIVINMKHGVSINYPEKKLLVGFCGEYNAGKTNLINHLFKLACALPKAPTKDISIISFKGDSSIALMDIPGFNQSIIDENEETINEIRNRDKVLKTILFDCDVIVYVINSLTLKVQIELSNLKKKCKESKSKKSLIVIYNNPSIVSKYTMDKYLNDLQRFSEAESDKDASPYYVIGNTECFYGNEETFRKIKEEIQEISSKNDIKERPVVKLNDIMKSSEENKMPQSKNNYEEFYTSSSPLYGYYVDNDKKQFVIDLELANTSEPNVSCIIIDSHYKFIITAKSKASPRKYIFKTPTSGDYYLQLKIPMTYAKLNLNKKEVTSDKGLVTVRYEIDSL